MRHLRRQYGKPSRSRSRLLLERSTVERRVDVSKTEHAYGAAIEAVQAGGEGGVE